LFIYPNTHADILSELTKRDRNNAVTFDWPVDFFSIYMENGCLITEVWEDGMDETSFVAYQLRDDTVKLIIRCKTWDFAYRIYELYGSRDRIDSILVDVHNYYLVEFVYINDKLEMYCNRVTDINTNGFMFNDAKIGSHANDLPYDGSLYYTDGLSLEEGMAAEILFFTNNLANQNQINSALLNLYDYMYRISVNGRELMVNGYYLDFSNRIKLF
jgi:hypothetical protein